MRPSIPLNPPLCLCNRGAVPGLVFGMTAHSALSPLRCSGSRAQSGPRVADGAAHSPPSAPDSRADEASHAHVQQPRPSGAPRGLAVLSYLLSLSFFFLNLEPYRLRYGLKSLDKVSSVKPLATRSSILRPLVGPWSTTPSARPCEAARARCIRGVAGDHTGSTPPMGLSGPSGSANVGSWRVEV